jgi:hypothetical protein
MLARLRATRPLASPGWSAGRKSRAACSGRLQLYATSILYSSAVGHRYPCDFISLYKLYARAARARRTRGQRSDKSCNLLEYSCNYSCRSIKCTMMRHMMAGASVVLQLRTQFLRVLSRPIKTLKKPFESLQSAAEPRQGAFRRSYC